MQRVEVLTSTAPDDAGPADELWRERRFRAMGSTVHLVVRGGSDAIVDWATNEVARLEQRWSRFRPGSDVSRANATPGVPVPVSAETVDLVERAVDLWATTGGCFDPTVLRALEANGYDETFERVRARRPDARHLASAPPGREPLHVVVPGRAGVTRDASPAPGCVGIVTDRDPCTLTLPEGTALDLGGIGKGFAADLIACGLLARGATAACVALGGDVRAAGPGPDDGVWRIPVEDPFDEQRTLLTYPLVDAAIVTSTRIFRCWVHDGRPRHHIIDPATGEPADRGVAAAIVVDGAAWRAEALAKAALVAGPVAGRELLTDHGVTGWLVDDEGEVA